MRQNLLSHKKYLLAILCCVALIGIQLTQEPTKKASLEPFQTHAMHFYEEPVFLPAVKAVDTSDKHSQNIKGGVIPHHLLPSELLARFFYKISLQNPKHILLIGPNHPEKGAKVATTDWGWKTAFGDVPPDADMISSFTKTGIPVEHEIVEHEHSVAGMMPFIKYFMPDARVATLILSNTLTLSEIDSIADNIIPLVGEDVVVIAPIDFSHYLTSSRAKKNDEITWDAIVNYNYKAILSMNNDYVDGRTSLVLELFLMKKLGYTNIALYEHTNSGEMMNDPYGSTTSYFSFGFSK